MAKRRRGNRHGEKVTPGVPCAGCGLAISDTYWVVLGDGAVVHYSGSHGRACMDRHANRRAAA